MSFPRYPAYKDSGVEWIGEVPKHWPLPPLYLRYEVLLGKMLDAKRQTGTKSLPYLRNVDVQWDRVNTQDLPQMDVDSTELERFTLLDGDLLVCEGGEVGRTAIWRDEGVVCAFQKAIHRVRPLSSIEEPRFLFHCMQHASSQGAFIANGNPNTIPHLTGEAFRLYRFPRPPVAEQRVIAAFLDRETAKIDALVAEQRRLMDLLKEKRQAVISHAVTKGLDPDALMKDSEVEWLGEVPAHWRSTRLRSLYRHVKRQDYPDQPVLSVYREFGVVRKDSRDDNMNKTPEDLSAYQLVRVGDLVINKMKAWQGSLGVSPLDGITSPDYVVFAPLHAESSEFLHLLMRSQCMVSSYGSISNGIRLAQWRLEPDQFLNLRAFLPSTEEQKRIAQFVSEQVARVDALVSEAERIVSVLLERRTALISAAVTGQIDVRGLATADAA